MTYDGSKKSYKSKILISIISIIIILLICIACGKSIATYLGSSSQGLNNIKSKGKSAVGDTVSASYNDLVSRNDYYCVMYQKPLHGTITYSVGRYISIKGNTATNDMGKSYTSIENGKLAYILSRGEGYGAQHAYTTTQRALYKSIESWYDSVGGRLGISNKWPSNTRVSGGDSLISEATEYAKNIGGDVSSSSESTDKTNKSKVTVTSYNDNNVEYLRVGPFNWKFSGKLTSIKVYGDNNGVISNVKYSKFEGNSEKFYDSVSDIKSGKDFYISIKANSGFTKIGKMTATTQSSGGSSTYSAQIWFLNSANMQNTILVDVGNDTSKPDSVETTFEYDIPLIKDIEIIKVDSINKDLKLNNVAFILQNKETGKYLKKSGSTYTFVNKTQATEFKTENGKISIKGVPVATYIAFETKNPNKGYEVPEKGVTIAVSDKTKRITNDYKLGKLKIEKIDGKFTNKKLENVEFTLVAKSGKYKGKYVGIDSKGNAYYSDVKIHIKTDINGVIQINDIWEGHYVLTEVENPIYGYVIDEKNVNVNVTIKPYDTTKLQMTNDYKLGKIRIEKVDLRDTRQTLKDVEFTLRAMSGRYEGQYVGVDNNGKAFYSYNVVYIKTNDMGVIEINEIWEGIYKLTETKNPNYGYLVDEENINIQLEVKPYETSNLQVKDRYRLGMFVIEKVDMKNYDIKLKDVEFTLKAITGEYAGKYVSVDSEGNAIYSDNEVIIKTNNEGRLQIDKVWEGKYILTEINNPNYGYIIDEKSKIINVDIVGYETWGDMVENEQVYIRLSGFIWLDEHSGKEMLRNDYYKTDGIPKDYVDNQDKAFNGIPVKLKRIDTGEIVKEGYSDRKEFTNKDQVTTSEEKGLYSEIDGGEYVFEYVRIDELSNYYVEFEYDGLIYQSVIPHLDHNNGSKASDEVERNVLDRNFATVNSTGKNEVNINNGNSDVYNIKYNETTEHSTSIKDSSDCILHAKTDDAGCNINNYFVQGQTEIRYINLGLYVKPQADMALAHDLENVHIGVNGYWHVYNYNKRGVSSKDSESWNVGVKFKNNYTGTYKRAVYKEDLEYETADKSKELQVYLTYKIAFKNESSYLTKVNNIVDYFDTRYTLVGAGTGLDSNNNVIGNVNVQKVQKYNDKYQKCIIDTNTVVQPFEMNCIYVQFKLERMAVMEIINNRETLYNCAEINSYTVYKDENQNTVAAVDKDSVPGNAVLGNVETFEDDVDSAPPVLLEINDSARSIQGTVFVDSTADELKTGEIRQGDGIFNEGEKTIEGVEVTLHELNNSIPDMITTTDSNGNFRFEAYIPGQYTITYVWGNKTYTVQYYKGTIYDVSRKQNDMYWYRGSEFGNDTIDVATRKTDAIDNYDTRIKIDKEISAITDNTIYEQIRKAYDGESSGITITKMDSITPTMEFSVEYDTAQTDGTIDKMEFIVKNVDFGIVERARQQLDMNKRVSSFRITLANGQVLADATIDEKGNLTGSHDYVTYMAPTSTNGFGFKGYVRTEMDNEILEGAKLEVRYEIKAINNSELDFMSEVYYKYGTTSGNIVTITPTAVVDYLDKNLSFEIDKNPDWKEITVTELNSLNAKVLGETDVDNFLHDKIILLTDKTAVALKPNETALVGLNVSKLLTTSNDLTFENDAETVSMEKPKGSTAIQGVTPQHTGSVIQYFPADSAEEVQITPSTGGNRDFVIPVIFGVTALLVLSFGVVSIKKRVIDK